MKQLVMMFFLCLRLCKIQGKDCPNPFQSKESVSKQGHQTTKGGSFMACSVKCIEDKDSCLGIELKDGKCFLQKSGSHDYFASNFFSQPHSSFLLKVLTQDNKLTEFRNPGRVWVSDVIVS